MYPLTQGHITQLEIPKIEKLTNEEFFFVIQEILTFHSYQYTPLQSYLNGVGKQLSLLFTVFILA